MEDKEVTSKLEKSLADMRNTHGIISRTMNTYDEKLINVLGQH